MSNNKSSSLSTGIRSIIVISFIIIIGFGLIIGIYFPKTASDLFGAMASDIHPVQKISLPVKLVMQKSALLSPNSLQIEDCLFSIAERETVQMITIRLIEKGFIANGEAFRNYLIYSGIDREIQSGSFCIPDHSNAIQVAQLLADPLQRMINVVILPGWRLEEIGQSVDSLGLAISSNQILELNFDPSLISFPADFEKIDSLEGWMAPGEYLVTKETSAQEFVTQAVERSLENLTAVLSEHKNESGLDTKQLMILASIIQREAQQADEMPLIASVFLNRIQAGMRLETDPTVQYALGFQSEAQGWWKNPLTYEDLRVQSPFNTYWIADLPPTPICAPSVEAISSVLQAPQTDYLFFRSMCDGSGYHQFSLTYEEHLSKACP